MIKFLFSFACVALLCSPAIAQTQAEIDYAQALRDQYFVLAEVSDAHRVIVDDLLESNDEADAKVEQFTDERSDAAIVAQSAYEAWMMVGYAQESEEHGWHLESQQELETAVFFLDLWTEVFNQRQYDLYLANDAYQTSYAATYAQGVLYYEYCIDNFIEIIWLDEA